MKKLRKYCKSYMIRPTLYRGFVKFIVALLALQLWGYFLNRGHMSTMRDGGLAIGMVLLAAAWIGYLRLDGVRLNNLPGNRPKKKRRRLFSGDIADYVDEHIITFDELEPDEQMACGMASSLFAALAFLIPSLVMP